MKICPKCRKSTAGNFCPSCGEKTIEQDDAISISKLKCPNCGKTLWEFGTYGTSYKPAKFCENCGYNLFDNFIKKVEDKDSILISYYIANNSLIYVETYNNGSHSVYNIPNGVSCICQGAFSNIEFECDYVYRPTNKVIIPSTVKCIQVKSLNGKESSPYLKYDGPSDKFFDIIQIKNGVCGYFDTPIYSFSKDSLYNDYKVVECKDKTIEMRDFRWKVMYIGERL